MPPETLGSLLLRLAGHQVFHHGPEAVVTRVDDLGRALGPTAVLPWPSLRILLRPHVFALSVFGIAVRLRADHQLCQKGYSKITPAATGSKPSGQEGNPI
ncbi:uncharacterized protein METZ01_LOCUS510371 [marine metagenome]|uniref:Uncharacterized protein n=1 Tax=marine metagenome TaxID=408172 RepID=A0A383EKZ3_9ZZZZ